MQTGRRQLHWRRYRLAIFAFRGLRDFISERAYQLRAIAEFRDIRALFISRHFTAPARCAE